MDKQAPAKITVTKHWTPPKSFDEYRLLWPFGRGGMGAVYLGHDMLLDRAVAVKFISAFNPDVISREQFLTEARAAARVQHPNVVTVYRVGEIDGRPYIIQEYLRGQSLEKTSKPLPETQVLELAIGLARGLAAAHRRGVLHRDLKPGNVMLPTDGGVKLLDFGLAKLLDVSHSQAIEVSEIIAAERKLGVDKPPPDVSVDLLAETMSGDSNPDSRPSGADSALDKTPVPAMALSQLPTPASRAKRTPLAEVPLSESPHSSDSQRQRLALQARLATAFGKDMREPESNLDDVWHADPVERSSTIKGTPLYMAPEVFDGEPASRQTDLYSLGAVLYEMCAGKPPHYSTSLVELHRLVTNHDAPPLPSVAPRVEPRLAAAIDKCLRRNPQERFQSADDLREAIERLLPSAHSPSIPEGNPYRGLLPFEPQHRALFFGRQSEIGTIVDRLRTEPFVVVAADSGVGKSSVCRAGVLPAIQEGALSGSLTHLVATMVPGRQPVRALCEQLEQVLDRDEQPLLAALKTDPASFPRVLRSLLPPKTSLTLFVDQLEELVTIADAPEAKLVSEAFGAMSQKAGELRLLATVRADFVSRVATLPGLGDEINRGLYLLRPMGAEKLREAIVGPAQLKGVVFETDELVDELVASTAESDAGLPLLQFALAELWDVRQGSCITRKALESIGGVTGALARHADNLLGALPKERRPLARRLLMSLVTLEGTRARRTQEELTRNEAEAKTVLETLVRGRLLVARETPDGTVFEVAHEALIRGWGTLKQWLEENAERRAVIHRLELATNEWLRLHKNRDVLWSGKQLGELALLEPDDIGPKEQTFVEASRASFRRNRRLRQIAWLMLPVVLVTAYVGVQIAAHRKLVRQIDQLLREADSAQAEAAQHDAETARLRAFSFAQFDQKNKEPGEQAWAKASKESALADRTYGHAAQVLESALSLDMHRDDVRERLAGVLYRRAQNAERDRQPEKRDELFERMLSYDKNGALRQRWNAPAKLSVATAPQGAVVQIRRYVNEENGRKTLTKSVELGVTPISENSLSPDSYLMTIQAAGRVAVRYPVRLERGEQLDLHIPLPTKEEIPKGFIYIPKGRFMFGYGQNDTLRKFFFGATPVHTIHLDAFLISEHETTYAEWIEFLNSISPAERKKYTPSVGKGSLGGSVDLKNLGKQGWQLVIRPQADAYSAKQGEPMLFSTRTKHKIQNWEKFPVGGISFSDMKAYVDWLNKTGKVRNARFCTEQEWERAAKGADEREYPHGDSLLPEDAAIDETYQKVPTSAGPTEVGSFPVSNSPFGVADLVGGNWDAVTSSINAGELALRGGSYFFDALTARSNNRMAVETELRSNDFGLRLCVTWSPTE